MKVDVKLVLKEGEYENWGGRCGGGGGWGGYMWWIAPVGNADKGVVLCGWRAEVKVGSRPSWRLQVPPALCGELVTVLFLTAIQHFEKSLISGENLLYGWQRCTKPVIIWLTPWELKVYMTFKRAPPCYTESVILMCFSVYVQLKL